MSRHPISSNDERDLEVAEEFLNYVVQSSSVKACTLSEMKEHTEKDPLLQSVMHCMKYGSWKYFQENEDLKLFESIANELCISNDGILLRGHRIVIPASLRRRVVMAAHEGHQGIAKTKSLLPCKNLVP